MKRNFINIILSLFLIFALSACENESKLITTDFLFKEGNFNIVHNEFLVCTQENSTEIYKVNRKNGKLRKYYSLKKSTLIDNKEDKILFKGEKEYFIYDVSNNEIIDLSVEEFPVLSHFVEINCRLSENADSLIVTKIIRNQEEPLKAGKTVIGYNLKNETGLYLYDLSGKKKNQVLISEFGIKKSVKLEMLTVGSDIKKLGVVFKCSALGTSFNDETYYTVDMTTGNYTKIGEYKNNEIMDDVSYYFFYGNYYVNINSSTLSAVDFTNMKIIKDNLPDSVVSNNVMIYIEENEEHFLLNCSNSGYIQCNIEKVNLELKSIDSEELSENNYYLSENNNLSKFHPSADFLQELSEEEFSAIYKTVSEKCYITILDEKLSILYK